MLAQNLKALRPIFHQIRPFCTVSSSLKQSGLFKAIYLLSFSFLFSKCISADTSSTSQTVTYQVPAVSVLSISGDVNFSNFTIPPAGQNFTSVTDSSSTYNVSNNAGTASKKVTGALSTSSPTGLSLYATLNAPAGATGLSNVLLSTSSQNLVTGINNGAFPNNQIMYTLTANVATAQIASAQTMSVVFTLVSGS